MQQRKRNLYLAWVAYQRRAVSLGDHLDLDVRFYHYRWEEKSFLRKVISYVPKWVCTLRDLWTMRPACVYVQVAPTPLLYAAWLYQRFSGAAYVADCHNTMLYDGHWIRWPFAKTLLRRADAVLIHNHDLVPYAEALQLDYVVVRDPLPRPQLGAPPVQIAGMVLGQSPYVIVPGSFASDEPLEMLFAAARQTPEIRYAFTWFAEKLPEALRRSAPANVVFTGFLAEPDFNQLYARAQGAIVLTSREGTQPSGASEAIAFEVPLIVSDIQTTRRLYGDKVLLVRNETDAVARAVREAVARFEYHQQQIRQLKDQFEAEVALQLDQLQKRLPTHLHTLEPTTAV